MSGIVYYDLIDFAFHIVSLLYSETSSRSSPVWKVFQVTEKKNSLGSLPSSLLLVIHVSLRTGLGGYLLSENNRIGSRGILELT